MSKKIEIVFPQIVIERREIEISNEQFDDVTNFCTEEVSDFIWSKMTDLEKEHTLGEKMMKSFVDDHLCGIHSIKDM